MARFEVGDAVRIDIPDIADPDFDDFHAREGEVIQVLQDQGAKVTGDERDSGPYRVEFADGETFDARSRDLRPPLSE